MQCPVCGVDIPEGTTVCPDCGTEVGTQEAAVEPSAAPSGEDVTAPTPIPTPVAPVPSLPAGAARLLLKRAGALTGDEFVVSGRVVVGRFDTETGPVDVDIANLPEASYISRHHAEIYQDPSGQWFMKDLGSRNGTFLRVSGTAQFQQLPPNQPTPISDGDEIAFGNARFVFRTQ